MVIDHINALKDLAVLAPPNLADHLIIVLLPTEAWQAGVGGQLVLAIYSLKWGQQAAQVTCSLLHTRWGLRKGDASPGRVTTDCKAA